MRGLQTDTKAAVVAKAFANAFAPVKDEVATLTVVVMELAAEVSKLRGELAKERGSIDGADHS